MKKLLVMLFAFALVLMHSPIDVQAQSRGKPVKQSKIKKSVLTAPEYYTTFVDGVFSIIRDDQDGVGQANLHSEDVMKFILIEGNLWEPLSDYKLLATADVGQQTDSKSNLAATIKELRLDKLKIYKLPVH
jgi:hypothetical protein